MSKIENGISLIEAPVHITCVIQGKSYTKKKYAIVPKGVLDGIRTLPCELHTGIDRSYNLDIELEKEESDCYCKLQVDPIIRRIANEYSWSEGIGLLEWELYELMIVDMAIKDECLNILLGLNKT